MRAICEERPRLTAALRGRGFEVADSQANFVWAAHPARHGRRAGGAPCARAACSWPPGDALGEPRHVRIAMRARAASERLLSAVDKAL